MMETLVIQMWGWCLHWFWKRRLCKLDLFFFLPLTKWNGPKLNIINKFLQIFLHIKRIKWQKGFSSQPSLLYHVCYMGVCSNMKYTVEYFCKMFKILDIYVKLYTTTFKTKTKKSKKISTNFLPLLRIPYHIRCTWKASPLYEIGNEFLMRNYMRTPCSRSDKSCFLELRRENPLLKK